ncbi:MAG: DUF2293 domain-containing protein [Breznakibacter sp.]
MPKITHTTRIVGLDAKGKLIGDYGEPLTPPGHWAFLPAGDAAVTRKVTAQSDHWRVQVKKGRRTISKGVWASAAVISETQRAVGAMRETSTYQKRSEYDKQRREHKQNLYKAEFLDAVKAFLRFHPVHKSTEEAIALAVTRHATPVGSGTVARTSMIPIGERASKAVIAWMRHHTTAYDSLNIARIKGERRAVRRQLAQQSAILLGKYRHGGAIPEDCPLKLAIKKLE